MFLVLSACNFVKVSPPASVTAVVLILSPRTLRLGKTNYGGSGTMARKWWRQASNQSPAPRPLQCPLLLLALRPWPEGALRRPQGQGSLGAGVL